MMNKLNFYKLIAFTEKNFNLMKKYLLWEAVFLFYTIVNMLVIGYIGLETGDRSRVMFLMIGSLLWGFLSVIFHELSVSVAWERWEGTLEYTFMAPVPRSIYVFGQSLFAVIYGIIRTIIALFVVIAFFNLDMDNSNVLSAVAVLAVSGISFMGLGIVASILPMLYPEKGEGATRIIEAGLLLVSGIYYNIDVLPLWMQKLSVFSPATYTLRAMRAALLENAGIREISHELAVLLLLGIILVPAGFYLFYLAEMYAKKAGKLSRHG